MEAHRTFLDLSGRPSNPDPKLTGMLQVAKPQVRAGVVPTPPPAPAPQAVRLTRQQRSVLVAQFEAGEGKKPLARAFGVDVRTVRAVITRA